MTYQRHTIGVDLGGTYLKLALLDRAGAARGSKPRATETNPAEGMVQNRAEGHDTFGG